MVDVQHRVFVASLLLDKKSVVTAVALDHDGSRAFLGLEQGILEEYTLAHVEDGIKASLTARKPIVFKVRLGLCKWQLALRQQECTTASLLLTRVFIDY